MAQKFRPTVDAKANPALQILTVESCAKRGPQQKFHKPSPFILFKVD